MPLPENTEPRHDRPVLIVTGASRGIGAACARAGARAGYRVVVNYRSSRDAALAVETDILGPMGGATLMRNVAPTIPLGRVGQPEEIANAAIWLLSPQASYVHGTTIDVSGGR